MSTRHHTDISRSSVRPRYTLLGTDSDGGTHLYRTIDETIFAFDADGRVTHRFDVHDHRVDTYMSHVEAVRGWADKRYGLDAVFAPLAEAFE